MKMIHPDVDAVADVVDATVYNAVWAPRGWTLLGEPEAYATDILGRPVKKLDDLKVEELKGLVSARGLEFPSSVSKKADVQKIFLDTFEDAPAATPATGDTDALAPAGNDNTKDK